MEGPSMVNHKKFFKRSLKGKKLKFSFFFLLLKRKNIGNFGAPGFTTKQKKL